MRGALLSACDVMNPTDIWASDMRKPNGRKSRIGLPVLHKNKRMMTYRVFTVQLVLVVVFVFGVTVTSNPFRKRDHAILNMHKTDPPSTKAKYKGVIIVTNHRSGSTFTGELFNQHEDVFYIFEPLIQARSGCGDEEDKMKILMRMLQCDLGSPEGFERITQDAGVRQRCISNNFCFREKSKVLCSREFCPHGNPRSCLGCDAVDPVMASDACSKKKFVVIKVIRLCDLQNLKGLITNSKFDIKILHLVRDPRGIYHSVTAVSRKSADGQILRVCEKVRNNLEIGEEEDWLRGKYKLVRYEDLCRIPLKMTRDIYEFTGLNMTQQIQRWVESNTNGSSTMMDARSFRVLRKMKMRRRRPKTKLKILRNLSNFRLKRAALMQSGVKLPNAVLNRIMNDPYTTTRNSTASWWKWLRTLTPQQVGYVQHKCSATMRLLGYNLIDSTNYTSDGSEVVLEPLCNDVTIGDC
uniref:hox4 protein isoform X1 n=1 Tax=Ciona intestinalis TaxID=7719 RepID=UPI00006A431D|nr:hox4 protein isoform X1 [Ciona intestinalis]|eukprot:XP_002127093.3 hox4 protein isoform X1 [Ciona intestinalis]